MKLSLIFVIALGCTVVGVLSDGVHHPRQGRRGFGRSGRQDDGSLPPLSSYGGNDDGALDNYVGGGGDGAFGDDAGAGDDNLAMLEKSVPGVPGEDYPIYAEVPESEFSCDGQVDGGYYADPAAECQVFHICSADGSGGLSIYSFLCPNGTIFNQNYFICDWWFNFDCSEAESRYSINDDFAAEREANSGAQSDDSAQSSYGVAPASNDYPDYTDAGAPAPVEAAYSSYGVGEEIAEDDGELAEDTSEEAAAGYGSPGADDAALDQYSEPREARRGRGGRRGRQGGRRGRGGRRLKGRGNGRRQNFRG